MLMSFVPWNFPPERSHFGIAVCLLRLSIHRPELCLRSSGFGFPRGENMQNGGMTLAAQMEERKSRSLSDSWAKLLDTGTGLPDHGVSVINHATLWDHIRTPLYGMESSSTSTAEIKDCWMNSPAGNDVSWPSNEVKILPSSQHSRQIAEQNRWIASSSPFCSSSNNNNNNNKTDDNKSNNNNAHGNREAFCYSDGNAGKFLFRPDAFPCGPFTKLLDPTNTLPPDSLDLELEGFPASSKVSIPLVQLPGPLKAPATFPSSNILTFQSNMNKLDMPYTSPSPKPVIVQQQKSGGSPSSSPSTSSSNNNLQKNAVDEGGECTTEQKRSSDQAGLFNAAFKKPRTEASAGPPMKVRKEKLGERITALQQLVSPFGKTDTASVLFEAMGYVKFLQDQVQVLSSPYLKGIPSSQKDMLLGGSDTGPTIMEWAMSEALRNPPVMKRLQDELERVVGMDRMVSESDLPHLVYLQAMVKETLRLHPAASLVERSLYAESCNVMDYEIPHKAHVIINLWAIGRDPKSWEDAEVFKPERFMERVGSEVDANGLDQNFAWLPFGAGRRTCPGRQLGMLLLEFGLAQLFHCFNWRLPLDGMNGKNQELDMTERFNGITLPRAHELRAIPTPRLECIGRLK